jgi:hypothetical protein
MMCGESIVLYIVLGLFIAGIVWVLHLFHAATKR